MDIDFPNSHMKNEIDSSEILPELKKIEFRINVAWLQLKNNNAPGHKKRKKIQLISLLSQIYQLFMTIFKQPVYSNNQ